MRLEIDLGEIGRITQNIQNLGPKIDSGIKRGLSATGFMVQREARRNAPYRDGYLERSIEFKTGRDYVDIFVPLNSPAGKYAKVMHDSEYNRGEKTMAKGSQAGRLYIKRAIDDNRANIIDEFKAVFRSL